MIPAPLTPDTLAFIRAAAERRLASKIADELGWDLPKLKRVASRFRIELIAPDPTMQVLAAKPLMPVQASRVGTIRGAPPIIASSTLKDIIAALPGNQAQVLRILSRNMDGRFMPARDIARLLDGVSPTPSSVAQAVFTIRRRLRPTRWLIDGTRSHAGGGYRLVETIPAP